MRLFPDTSALFAAVLSEKAGSRLILKSGGAGAVRLWGGPRVLPEADAVLVRKAGENKALFAFLLDRAKVCVGPEPDDTALARARTVVDYPPDARIVAEALTGHTEYLISLDREHLVGNPRTPELPFPIGTPGEFLVWFHEHLQEST